VTPVLNKLKPTSSMRHIILLLGVFQIYLSTCAYAQRINIQVLNTVDTLSEYGIGQLEYILISHDTQNTQVNLVAIDLSYSTNQTDWHQYRVFSPLKYAYPVNLATNDTLQYFFSLFPIFCDPSNDSIYDVKNTSEFFLRLSIKFDTDQSLMIEKVISNNVLRKLPVPSDVEYKAMEFIKKEIYPYAPEIKYLTTPQYTGINYHVQNRLDRFSQEYPDSNLNQFIELDRLWRDFNIQLTHSTGTKQKAIAIYQYLESLNIRAWQPMINELKNIVK
jgi:hypothetical protein